jgi:hypothetical protein
LTAPAIIIGVAAVIAVEEIGQESSTALYAKPHSLSFEL